MSLLHPALKFVLHHPTEGCYECINLGVFCTLECLFILNIHAEILEHMQNLNTCSMFPIISLEKEAPENQKYILSRKWYKKQQQEEK